MKLRQKTSQRGFTLVEVVLSLAIIAVSIGAILKVYAQAGRRAGWAAYSLAAQNMGIQTIEQARAAVWTPGLQDDFASLPLTGWNNIGGNVWTGYCIANLDVPLADTNNPIKATNFVRLDWPSYVDAATLTTYPNVSLKMLTVDTVWAFPTKNYSGTNTVFTNRTVTYFAPD